MNQTKPPAKLAVRGRRFWQDVTAEYELSRAELEQLAEVCRSLDLIEQLRKAIDCDGVMVRGSEGQPRVNPAVTQINATRTLLGRQLATLALPDPEGDAVPSQETVKARKAAQARWAEHNARKAARRGTA